MISDGTVSLLWRPVDRSYSDTEAASWAWRVRERVTATDLTFRGGDDRNLSVYFVFVEKGRADALTVGSARRILREESARSPRHGNFRAVAQKISDRFAIQNERLIGLVGQAPICRGIHKHRLSEVPLVSWTPTWFSFCCISSKATDEGMPLFVCFRIGL